jgi:hypothetical protein
MPLRSTSAPRICSIAMTIKRVACIGGPTYTQVNGSLGPTNAFYVQPRTVFIQLQRAVGRDSGATLPRTSL